ncbi:DUF6113 family protein [Nocardioides mangrovi]|uniref:Uncharacterized protein n=1 Tax=Nocardioides mangrovi TaxID=2874580 RepID=A0ABS7UGC5_9ACTN|nr:hypothetical protein [Nocardioides mangrovi]MBZ5740081.1 hypothetical protein [Nocardioides mangrovi]
MRLLAAVGLLVVGAVTGIAAVAVHDRVWGFVLAAAATVVTTLALPPGWWSRLAFAIGWVAMVGWLTIPRPEGDYLISQDWQGYSVLGIALLLPIVAVGTLPRPRPRDPRTGTP